MEESNSGVTFDSYLFFLNGLVAEIVIELINYVFKGL